MTGEARADVGIVTVIPAELRAALAALKMNPEARTMRSGTNYWRGLVYCSRAKRECDVVVVCIGNAGNYDCATVTSELISEVQPRLLILMGIAAGMRQVSRIGEVILCDQVFAYEGAAVTEDGAQPRPQVSRSTHCVSQDIALYLGQLDPSRIKDSEDVAFLEEYLSADTEGLYARAITVKQATVASGEKLLRDPALLRRLRESQHGKIEAGEMEAAGLAHACHRHSSGWLVVRGISDFGDSFKDDRFHALACSRAAIIVADFLAYGFEPRPDVTDFAVQSEWLNGQHETTIGRLQQRVHELEALHTREGAPVAPDEVRLLVATAAYGQPPPEPVSGTSLSVDACESPQPPEIERLTGEIDRSVAGPQGSDASSADSHLVSSGIPQPEARALVEGRAKSLQRDIENALAVWEWRTAERLSGELDVLLSDMASHLPKGFLVELYELLARAAVSGPAPPDPAAVARAKFFIKRSRNV